jgi:hypothetical protein
VHVLPPGEDVTVYLEIGEPLSAGASHVITAAPGRGWADGLTTADGLVKGLKAALGSDAGPSPIELVAATVRVYATPLSRSVMVHVRPGVLQVLPPGCAVTV